MEIGANDAILNHGNNGQVVFIPEVQFFQALSQPTFVGFQFIDGIVGGQTDTIKNTVTALADSNVGCNFLLRIDNFVPVANMLSYFALAASLA